MGEQMSRQQVLKLYNEARKNLKLLSKIDIEKIPFADLRELGRNLTLLRTLGYDAIDSQEFGLLDQKYHSYTEVFENIDSIATNGNFNIYLKETGLEKVNLFEPLSQSLAAQRLQLQQLLQEEINIPDFPLRIIPSKLNTIVAPSHSGKTFYATALSLSLARRGSKVLFVSTEEDKLAFIERTQHIDINDKAFHNLTLVDLHTFNSQTLYNLMRKAEEEEYDFVFFDYLKKSMWDTYSNDAVVMEQMVSTVLKAIQDMNHKLSVFTFVQANRTVNEKYESIADFRNNIDNAVIMIDGGMPVFRSSENLVFLYKDKTTQKRYMVVAKARRQNNRLGDIVEYNIDIEDFTLQTKQGLFEAPRTQHKKSNQGW